jgi:hypothetical protein
MDDIRIDVALIGISGIYAMPLLFTYSAMSATFSA